MGEIVQGVNGGFSGKTGSVIGSHWRGIDYMKGRPRKSSKPASQAQVEQKQRFSVIVALLAPLKKLLEESYSSADTTRATGYNIAVSDNLNEAVTGVYPDFKIDFSKVKISRGSLAKLFGMKIDSVSAGKVTASWQAFSNGYNAFDTDKAYIVLYNVQKEALLLSVGEAMRGDGKIDITVPEDFSGDTIEGLIFFASLDGRFSPTAYLGSIMAY